MDNTTRLQVYADAHWGGDRYRAIHDLLINGTNNVFDDYVDELNQEEANFALIVIRNHTARAMGGEENFRRQLKAEQLAIALNTETDTVLAADRNPHCKPLLTALALLAAAIVLPALLMLLLTKLEASSDWVAVVQTVLIGWTAMRCATAVQSFLRWRKIRRLLAGIPPAPESFAPPTYEECVQAYWDIMQHHKPIRPTQAEEVVQALDSAKRQNILALALLPAYITMVSLSTLLPAKAGIPGCIAGCSGLIFFFLWICKSCWTKVIGTRDALNGLPRDTQGYDRLNTRQSLCVLAMICLLGLYLIAVFVGCGVCITLLAG